MLALLPDPDLFKSSLKSYVFFFLEFLLKQNTVFLNVAIGYKKKQDNLPGEGDLEGLLLLNFVISVALF